MTHAQPLAERTAGDTYAGQALVRGGMPLQARVELAEGLQLFQWEVAVARQHAVEHRTDVAVAEEEEVLADAVHGEIFRIMAHLVEVQCDEEVRATERTAGVAALAAVYHAHNVAAHLAGDGLELFDGSAFGGGL